MPEGVEIELYRRATEPVVGRTVSSVVAADDWFLKGGITEAEVTEALVGATVEAARRKGKLLVLDLSNGVRLGLRFGMTGRPIVDEAMAIDDLEYASNDYRREWDRFEMHFGAGGAAGGGSWRLQDPRRLGGVELDPDEDALGADAFTATLGDLRKRVLVGEVALKARLMDQSRLAGVGQPHRRRDAVAGRTGSGPAGRWPVGGRGEEAAPPSAQRAEGLPGRRRLAHRPAPAGPGPGRVVPEVRDGVATTPGRWSHHVLLPSPPGVKTLG
ncbi:MAG: DNA-formamidopyrimidine glycosylase family protein [Planctomycetota bacterium]